MARTKVGVSLLKAALFRDGLETVYFNKRRARKYRVYPSIKDKLLTWKEEPVIRPCNIGCGFCSKVEFCEGKLGLCCQQRQHVGDCVQSLGGNVTLYNSYIMGKDIVSLIPQLCTNICSYIK